MQEGVFALLLKGNFPLTFLKIKEIFLLVLASERTCFYRNNILRQIWPCPFQSWENNHKKQINPCSPSAELWKMIWDYYMWRMTIIPRPIQPHFNLNQKILSGENKYRMKFAILWIRIHQICISNFPATGEVIKMLNSMGFCTTASLSLFYYHPRCASPLT